jgi:hypothetical protein
MLIHLLTNWARSIDSSVYGEVPRPRSGGLRGDVNNPAGEVVTINTQDRFLGPPAPINPTSRKQFKGEASTHVWAIPRTRVQRDQVTVSGKEVEISPGPGSDLIASTVLWMETKSTMIRRVTVGESAMEHVFTHLGETIEACPEEGTLTIRVANPALLDQWEA